MILLHIAVDVLYVTEIDNCDSSPCQHQATCVNFVNGYMCTCVTGYTGYNCQTR